MLVYNERSGVENYNKSVIPAHALSIHRKKVGEETSTSVLRPDNIHFLKSLKLKVKHNVEHQKE